MDKGQSYRQNYGYHERRQAIAIGEYLQGLQTEQSQIDCQMLGEAIASALIEQNQPLEEKRNLSISRKQWGRYFYASQQPGQVVGVLHQSLATNGTQHRLWILLYDQASGSPNSELEPRIVGFVGKGSMDSNGNDWVYNYGKGLVFESGILACLSLSEFVYEPPEFVDLSISVRFHGVPAQEEIYDFAPLPS